MTIHHDKAAYGKLAPSKEELSEEEILKMVQIIARSEEQEKNTENKNGKPNEN